MCGFLYCIFIGARRTVFPGPLSMPHHPGERWRWRGRAQEVTRLGEILCVHIVLTWRGGLSRGCPEVRLWLHANLCKMRGVCWSDLGVLFNPGFLLEVSCSCWIPTRSVLSQPPVPEMLAEGWAEQVLPLCSLFPRPRGGACGSVLNTICCGVRSTLFFLPHLRDKLDAILNNHRLIKMGTILTTLTTSLPHLS